LTFNSLGASVFIFGLSTLIYAFTFLCNDVSGCPAPSLLDPSTLSLDKLKEEVNWPQDGLNAFFDIQVTLWVLSYYLLSLVLYVFLPGEVVEGTELACKGRLRYKFNGMNHWMLFLWYRLIWF
jgi:delta14-sterol reductase